MKYSSKHRQVKKPDDFRKSFLASLALHGILVLLLLYTGAVKLPGQPGGQESEEQGQGSQKRDNFGEFKDAPTEVEVQIIEHPIEKDKDGTQKETDDQANWCNGGPTYGGVGISHNWDDTVREAPPQYPAYKSGVRVGDQILNTNELRGEPGTPVTIRLYRGSQYYEFTATRAKICYSDTKP